VRSALNGKTLFLQKRANPIAKIALKLDAILEHGATGTTGPLQFLTERLQEFGVARKTRNDRDGLAAPSARFHPQLRDDPFRDGFFGALPAAGAVGRGPAAAGTDSSGAARVHGSGISIRHDTIMRDRTSVRNSRSRMET